MATEESSPRMAMMYWDNPHYIHEILNMSGTDRVHICPACTKKGKATCPNLGQEPVGVCDAYDLDKTDPAATHSRVMRAINEHAADRSRLRLPETRQKAFAGQ